MAEANLEARDMEAMLLEAEAEAEEEEADEQEEMQREDDNNDEEDGDDDDDDDEEAEDQTSGDRGVHLLLTESEIEERVSAYLKLPPILNDEGHAVAFGKSGDPNRTRIELNADYSLTVFCGRNLGRRAIPGSDGMCGPDDGPQCASCKRLQRGPGRLDLMARKFPGLTREAFVGALRATGGMMAVAITYLREEEGEGSPLGFGLGAKECEVRSNLALLPVALQKQNQPSGGAGAAPTAPAPPADQPPAPPANNFLRDFEEALGMRGRRPAAADPGAELVANLMETFQIEREAADVALRRNGNNLEQAGAWLVDTEAEDIAAAVRERQEEVAAQEGELKLLQRHQAEEVRRALGAAVPRKVLDVAEKVSRLLSPSVEGDIEAAVRMGQHSMSQVPDESLSSDEEVNVTSSCFHCAATLPAGAFRCDLCQLCEGCILESVCGCPRLYNGGHLHHHPLTYNQDKARRGTSCDIRNADCQRHLNSWTCAECDFDVCYACIKAVKPDRWDRRALTQVPEADASAHNHTEDEGVFPTFDAMSFEREAAARWEGNYVPEVEVELVVGTGAVESTGPPPDPQGDRAPYRDGNRRGGRLVQRSGTFHRNPTLITETQLPGEAVYALSRFKDPNRIGTTKNDDVIAAADVTQAETILQRLHAVDDKATSRAVCEAIASGRLDLGGALLLSEAFAPVDPKRSNNAEEDGSDDDDEASNTMTCLCCHTEINLETAPDGAVGCLSGHPMHASCAADLLLGGKKCPACNISLFYAKVPHTEATAAAEMAKEELARVEAKEADERKLKRGEVIELQKGDIIKLCPDVELCAKVMKQNPLSGGWDDDLAFQCGNEFCVVNVKKNETSGRIEARPLLRKSHWLVPIRRHGHQCTRCSMRGPSLETGNKKCKLCSLCQLCCLKSGGLCDSEGSLFSWHPSLVTLVRRAGSAPVGDEACVDEEELITKEARNHLIRLRSELAAVKCARDNTKTMLPPRPTSITRDLTAQSSDAIRFVRDKVSPADWYRARHLLLLARLWGDSREAKARRAQLYDLVKKGELDSVARLVRRHNAARTIEESKWEDAAASRHEYIVKPTATAQLHAFPSLSGPKTGFYLQPKSRFSSKKEIVDSNGSLWIQVSDESFFDQSSLQGDVSYDGENRAKIIGARVVRGENWNHGRQDGGKGTKGTIVAAKKAGCVVVEWDGGSRLYNYAATAGSRKLTYAPATPPPQGWICLRASGPASPSIATLARSPFRCFSCGDGITFPQPSSGSFRPAEKIECGDSLCVAATLEPVKAEKVDGNRVYCSFIQKDGRMYDDNIAQEDLVWYRPEDLLTRHEHVTKSDADSSDDVAVVQGKPRTRRELVLMFGGDVAKAKTAWDEAVKEAGPVPIDDDPSFASCARGHLLHARCFQGALLSGQSCPAKGCVEPLFLPQIKIQQDEDTCCSARNDSNEAEVEALRAAAAVADHAHEADADETQADEHQFNSAGITGLKMCPSCCAGPLMNKECHDMQAHHGQCTAYALGDGSSEPCTPEGAFRVPASQILAEIVKLGDGQSVADVLPRCPKHSVVIMFNGCMACGYLFTDTSWGDMPRWDPKAKALLELDKKKRKAAMLLAEQIRMESTMLDFERSALWKLQEDEQSDFSGDETTCIVKKKKIEPPAAPAVPAYEVNLHEPKNSVSTNNNAEEHPLARFFLGGDEGDY